MDTNKPLSLFLVAVLAASIFTVVGITSMPLRIADAQTVTIETSADNFDGLFFGHSAVQVVIEDEDTNDDDPDDIEVVVEAGGVSDSFTIPNTSDGSQRFEFFIIHEESDYNNAAFFDGIADTPTLVTFGDGGDLDTGEDLFVDETVEVRYRGQTVTLDYEESEAELELDRDSYGSDSLVYVRIIDQDQNNNPTEEDEFVLTEAEMNTLLFEIEGGAFDDIAPAGIAFNETGDNTAVFEAEIFLAPTAGFDEFDASEDTVVLTLNDQALYNTTSGNSTGAVAIEDGFTNDSPDTSEFSFEIDNTDGDVSDVADLSFSSELKLTVTDPDQNRDSDEEDTITDGLTVTSDGPGGDSVTLDLKETGDNTGIFEIDLSNGELDITFLSDGVAPNGANSVLELTPDDISESVLIEYTDPLADNAAENGDAVVSFTVDVLNTVGQVSAPEEVGVTDEFTVTITDSDLNDDARTRDSYVWNLTSDSPFNLTRGGLNYADIYTLEIEIDGDPLNFDDNPITVTLRETGVNTGIFEMEFDVEDDFSEAAGAELSDGDDIEFTINDFMDDPDQADDDTATVTIGKPSTGLDYDRTTVPLPPQDDSSAADGTVGVGGDVMVRLILVDPTLGTQSNVEETFPVEFGNTAGNFTIEVDGDDVDDCDVGPGDDLDDCTLAPGVTLDNILTIGDLEETGDNTNVFESELVFNILATTLQSSDLQDTEVTFTYTNDEGDDETAGFTFRGNDGIVSVDQPSAKGGTTITVTVEDQDLNLDSEEIETFESTLDTDGAYLVSVETEDDTVDGGDTQTFEETGEDTGIFTAEFEVGEDIPVVDVDNEDQASSILVTFNDETDSTGDDNEIEISVPVVSSTASIQVTPALVGPATTLTVLIIDSDLDEDPSSTDEYTAEDLDERVEFSSSRNEVNDAVPDIEETGPNTGVFMFELELITDAELCAEDDLDDGSGDFEATGGDTDSSIGACPGDLVSIRYDDEVTGSGGGATVSEVVEVQAFDPEFVADKDSYAVGDRVTVTISDPDANRDPDIADSLTDIRVRSDSDQVGEELSAIETGRDTGVFRLAFGTTSGTAGGAISVKTGDDITVVYTDEFPADFEEEEEDKDFEFTVSVGGDVSSGATTVTPPAAQDVSGQDLDEITVGKQVVLTTSVRNNNQGNQPFVALIEVRDSSDVTQYLAWQTGTLSPNGQTQVGLSWTPEIADDYTVRTFVISSLNNPQILSPVSESDIAVS